jgi:hypothetical protein
VSALNLIALGWIGVAAIVFASLLRTVAPYGRHARPGWGPAIPAMAGWVVMETASLGAIVALFVASGPTLNRVARVFFWAWVFHYAHRSFIYPLRARQRGKTMPVSVALMAVTFNAVNAGLNGWWFFFVLDRDASWFVDPRFLVGAALFAAGFALNVQSDSILFGLRRPGETGYRIPHGGGFSYVSCPNYLGEIVEWCGFALAAWSLPALSFAAWTAVNLVPRALAHHRWYLERFPAYPRDRKAIVPFVL